jgi:hypothetical protein
MKFLFVCPKCRAGYEISRQKEPLPSAPTCVDCGEDLPWGDAGGWFSCRRLGPDPPPQKPAPSLKSLLASDRINRTRTTAMGETNVFEHAIVDVPSVAAESQTVHPKMKREFSAEGANSIE